VSLAASQIMSGMEDLVIAGGTEMMSYTSSIADPTKPMMMDSDNLRLRKKHPQSQQGVCADAIATLEGIDREAADQLAVLSQKNAAQAIEEGRFDRALVPVFNEDGTLALERDEFPRPGTTMESLAGLRTVFDNYAKFPIDESGTTFGDLIYHGDCPTLMLNAPVPAAHKVLKRAGMKIEDIDLFEINEAFAVVAEKFIRDLDLDRSKVNVSGGAMALGHPIAATGSILIGTLLDDLHRTGGRYGLVTMCAAGGMAPAMIIERL